MSVSWSGIRSRSWSAFLVGGVILLALMPPTLQAQAAVPRGVREAAAAQQAPAQASSLPPTSTTTMNPVHPAGAAAPTASAGAMPTKLELQYANGQIALDATNVGLNQILREISIKTGLKITGGVADQKVFGHYGPATVGTVLASLLEGTGSNMLLVNASTGPSQLILTPRQGGVTPPSPMAAEPQPYNSYAERQGRGSFLGQRADSSPVAPPPSYQTPPQAEPSAAESQATSQTSDPNAAGQSPNGVKTPLQIYQELQQLRQAATTPPATPTAPPQ